MNPDLPLVSVITPTVADRRHVLVGRAIPSVQAQDYPNIEHVIVCDGPTSHAAPAFRDTRYIELGRNWKKATKGASYGAVPRVVGTCLARGDYIAYLDDDDEYLPCHVRKHMEVLAAEPSLDFTISQFKQIWNDGSPTRIIGRAIANGQIGTPCVVHRVHCLAVRQWQNNFYGEDIDLFSAWERAGLKFKFIPEVTSIVYKRAN